MGKLPQVCVVGEGGPVHIKNWSLAKSACWHHSDGPISCDPVKEAFAHQAALLALKTSESIPGRPHRPESRLTAQMALYFSLHQLKPCRAKEPRAPRLGVVLTLMLWPAASILMLDTIEIMSLPFPSSFFPFFLFCLHLSHTVSFCCSHARCLTQLQAHSLFSFSHTLTFAFMLGFTKTGEWWKNVTE